MKISLSKISQVLPEFVDTRLMPSAPSTMKWLLGGSTFLILHQADTLIGKYLPMLKQVGIVDENNKVDNEGNGVVACLVPDATGKIKSNALKFRTINMDESSATKTRTFKVYINATAEISNTNFGLGQLFPTTK